MSEPTTHLMIDLETMGTAVNSPVLAIGAVYFEPSTGALGDRFYAAIDPEDAFRYGRVSGGTVKWWMKQPDAAREAVMKGTKTAAEAFGAFEVFCHKHGGADHVQPWGNGAAFDISILDYAFVRILERAAPWQFWNVRDCRTIKEIASGLAFVPKTARTGTHHQALDDAVFQAQWVSEMWQVLRGQKIATPRKELLMDDLLA